MSDREAGGLGSAAKRLAPLVILCLAWLVAVGALLGGEQTLFYRDIFLNHYPMRLFSTKALIGGEFPAWNPYLFCGVPYAADPISALFYPLNALFFLGDFTDAFNIYFAAHYLIAALGAYLLALEVGGRRGPAALAAGAYALSGVLGSHSSLIQFLSSHAWAPLSLLLLKKALDRPGGRATALAGLVLAVQVLAGDPQTILLEALVSLAYLACLRKVPSFGRKRDAFLGAWALAALVAAVQLLPSLLLAGIASRAADVTAESALRWSLHPLRLLEFFLPLVYGAIYPQNDFWGNALVAYGDRAPYLPSLYLGVIPLFAALLARRYKGDGTTRFLAAWFVAMLLLAAGTPLYDLFFKVVPTWSFYRYPSRVIVPGVLALSLLAARSSSLYLGEWEGAGEKERRAIVGGLLRRATVLVLAIALLGTLGLLYAGELRDALASNPKVTAETVRAVILASLLRSAAAGLAAILLLTALRLAPRRGRPILLLLLAVSLVDSALAARRVIWTAPEKVLTFNPLLRKHLPEPGPGGTPPRIHVESPPGGSHPVYKGLQGALLSRIVWKRELLFPDIGVPEGAAYLDGYGSVKTMWYAEAEKKLPQERFLSLAGVSRLVVASDVKTRYDGAGWLEKLHDDPARSIKIFKVKNTLPRAYFEGSAPLGEGPQSGGRCEISRYALSEVKLACSSAGPGRLVLGDSYAPGWRAEVDGKAAPVLRANIFQRAVPISGPGKHEIRLYYETPGLKFGAALTLAGLILCGAVILFSSSGRGGREGRGYSSR